MKALFRFDPALSPFKNAIEALGVPHTEVGCVRVNGAPATLQRIVREADHVEIEGWKSGSDPDFPFVADAHLGGLARFLRMAGFDTLHRNAFSDEEIRRIAQAENRIVLTRDRELLKCREIRRGAYVRALQPQAQLREVAERFGLAGHARPFTLCLNCNLVLEPVEKRDVEGRVPEAVYRLQERFMRCAGCGGLFWPGTHYDRMQATLGALLAV